MENSQISTDATDVFTVAERVARASSAFVRANERALSDAAATRDGTTRAR
jgi:hypothetical protein